MAAVRRKQLQWVHELRVGVELQGDQHVLSPVYMRWYLRRGDKGGVCIYYLHSIIITIVCSIV